MKRNNLKPIVISALMAVSFGATTVGTSFALFTDRADTKIEVTAGIVDLDIEYANLKAYSLDETDNTKLVEVSGGKFATKGTYALNDETGVVTLDRMVPGDKVEFDIKLTNKSNVKTKYRFAMSKSGALAPYLKASFGEATLVWTELEPASKAEGDLVNTAHVVIEFPNTTNEITVREEGYDNSAQGLSATYKLGYELVQGNAHTVDTAPAIAPSSATVNPVQDEDDDSLYFFNVATNDGLAMASGQAKDAAPVTLTISTATDGNFSIEGAVSANYDIQVENRMPDEEVTVSVYVGEGFETVYVFHANETIPLDDVEYDAKSGYVTFTTASFSPFHFACVEEEMTFVSTSAELVAAGAAGGKVHLANDIDLDNIVDICTDFELFGHDYKVNTTGSTLSRAFNIDGDNTNGAKELDIVFHDVTINSTKERGISMYGQPNVNLTLDRTSVSADMYAINVASNCANSTLNIFNSSVSTGWCAVQSWSANVTLNAKDSTFKGTNDKSYNAEGWNNFSTIVFNEPASGNVFNFEKCEIITGYKTYSEGNHNDQSIVSFRATGGSTINFKACDFKFEIDGVEVEQEDYESGLFTANSQEAAQKAVVNIED